MGFTVVQKQMVAVRGMFVSRASERFSWKLTEVNSLLDSCISDGYICRIAREGDSQFLIKTTSKGEDFCGLSDLIQAQLSQYDKVAVMIGSAIATLAAILGVKYGWKTLEVALKTLTGH